MVALSRIWPGRCGARCGSTARRGQGHRRDRGQVPEHRL